MEVGTDERSEGGASEDRGREGEGGGGVSFVGGVVVRSKERSEIRHTLQRSRASVLTPGYGTEPSRVDAPAWRSLYAWA